MSQKINVLNGWLGTEIKKSRCQDASLKNKYLMKRSNAGIIFKQLCWLGWKAVKKKYGESGDLG